MMMGEMNEMYRRAKQKADDEKKQQAHEAETLDDFNRIVGNP